MKKMLWAAAENSVRLEVRGQQRQVALPQNLKKKDKSLEGMECFGNLPHGTCQKHVLAKL